MNNTFMVYNFKVVVFLLINFLLTPLCISAAEESPKAVTVADIAVVQDRIPMDISFEPASVRLVTNKAYPENTLLTKGTVSMHYVPEAQFSPSASIAYRFTPNLPCQMFISDSEVLVGNPSGEQFNVKFGHEESYINVKTIGAETYHVDMRDRHGDFETLFDLFFGQRVTFTKAGTYSISIDYASYIF